MVSRERLAALETAGWRITRDGSTATARLNWEEAADPDCAWELMILHTAGHPNRFSLDTEGLAERTPSDLASLRAALAAAGELLADWTGELPDESEA